MIEETKALPLTLLPGTKEHRFLKRWDGALLQCGPFDNGIHSRPPLFLMSEILRSHLDTVDTLFAVIAASTATAAFARNLLSPGVPNTLEHSIYYKGSDYGGSDTG